MLLGQVHFRGETPTETLMAHIHRPVPLPTEVDPQFDPGLESALLRALTKEPEERYASAGELVEALRSGWQPENGDQVFASAKTVVRRGVGWPSSNRLRWLRPSPKLALIAVVSALVVAGATAVVLVTVYDSQEPDTGERSASVAPLKRGPPRTTAAPSPGEELRTTAVAGLLPGMVLSTVFQRVHAIRGLDPLQEVVPRFLPSGVLRDRLLEAEGLQREAIAREQALASTLGLIPEGLDLVRLGLDSVAEPFEVGDGRAASYDRTARELYIRDELAEIATFDDLGISEEFEIVVGYTIALLEQHFDIGDLETRAAGNSDQRAAIEALIIGDASTVGQEYMSAHISPDRFASAPAPKQRAVVEGSPEFVKRRALFAPQGGTNFIASLRKSGQWEGMRLVYKSPPVSSEQIIHPESYLEGDEPVAVTLPDLTAALGQGWAERHNGVMGESFLRAYLAQLSKSGFVEAAAGWGGDRFSLLEGPSGQMVLVALFVWDTPQDADQFADVVRSSSQASQEASIQVNLDRVLLIVGPKSTYGPLLALFN